MIHGVFGVQSFVVVIVVVVVVVVVVVTFGHQAKGIAPIDVLVLITMFSAIGAITENGPCTHYSFVEVQHQTVPHE